METIIKLAKSFGAGGFVFSIFYLVGSFGNASFNIGTWNEPSLAAVSVFGLIAVLITMGVTFDKLNDKKE